jgi:hypothetical protein
MLYHVSRNGQNYGPYTLEDLRRYVASGNILATDMAKSDDMPNWVPVSQVLGMEATAPAPAYQQPLNPAYPASNVAVYPDAPNLSWILVLLFEVLSCSLFRWVWNLVLAAWLKRVQPNSKAILYYAVATVLACVEIIVSSRHRVVLQPGVHWWVTYYTGHPLTHILTITGWIVRLIARFTMRSELEQHFNTVEPVGLSLSGVMTFFFGGIYFQYHINRINELKRMARYRGAAI